MADTAVGTLGVAQAAADVTGAMADVADAMATIGSIGKLASAAGPLGAIFGIAAAVIELAFGGGESEELTYMKEQFQVVRDKLDKVSDQLKEVLRAVEKATINNQYFPIEENLKNQFRKYMDILNASSKFRQKEKEEFLSHFEATKADQNLHTLFDGVMGHSIIFGRSILDTAMEYDERNRRLLEELCSRLKELFCIGLIATLGHATLTGNDVDALKKEWNGKLAQVESKMKSMVDKCINEFVDQAKIDVEKWLRVRGNKYHKELAEDLRDKLRKKFDWVHWAVLVYDPIGGSENHSSLGGNLFYFYRQSGVNVVVSYCTSLYDISAKHIEWMMEKFKDCQVASKVAEHVSHNCRGHVVHTVIRYKGLWGCSSFPSNCYFWQTYPGVTLCVHAGKPSP